MLIILNFPRIYYYRCARLFIRSYANNNSRTAKHFFMEFDPGGF
jgi:hypothetical protein